MLSQFQRIGSGCGIEIRGADLHVMAVKSRRTGLSVLGFAKIQNFRERPAVEWGREYAEFLASCNYAHVSATVSLPREDVMVRQIQLPAMGEKERAAAVRYQLDGLHPFAEDEVFHAYAALDADAKGPSPVIVVVAEQKTVTHYADLFEEAGIAVAAFTVSASSLRAALQLRTDRIASPLLVVNRDGQALEIYGESAGRAALSVEFDLAAVPAEHALQLAEADLRLDRGETAVLLLAGEPLDVDAATALTPASVGEVFPVPVSAPADFDLSRDLQSLATAIESACPRLGWGANLLPADRRRSDSRLVWIPTAVLAGLLVLLGIGFLFRSTVQNRAYAAVIEQRLAALQDVVDSAESNREATAELRERISVLEGQAARTVQDLRILSEVSSLLPESAWLQSLTINDDGIRLSGETDNAAPLLGVLNQARTVQGVAFATSLVRRDDKERFEISAQRGVPGAQPIAEPQGAATPAPAPAEAEPASEETPEAIP
jgi:Tfp pilus assembly protein PilN